MTEKPADLLRIRRMPKLRQPKLVLALSGWMDGGDVSTGTINRLIRLLDAEPFAEIDSDPFYIYNFPGSMEFTAIFRPHVDIQDGLIKSLQMPENVFYVHEPGDLVLFVGKEPNLRWVAFADCLFHLAHQLGARQIVFVGSFGGAVPHTREPRLYAVCSDETLLPQMKPYGLRLSSYEGPGSLTSYLMTRSGAEGMQMISLAAEIPGYLQGTNPMSIEAVTRRLTKMLHLRLDLDPLRTASTEWELEVSNAIEQNPELAQRVRELEDQYDNELLQQDADEV